MRVSMNCRCYSYTVNIYSPQPGWRSCVKKGYMKDVITFIYLWEGLWGDLQLLTVVGFSFFKELTYWNLSTLSILQLLSSLLMHFYCLWVWRLLCSLGCSSETSLSVSWCWEEDRYYHLEQALTQHIFSCRCLGFLVSCHKYCAIA